MDNPNLHTVSPPESLSLTRRQLLKALLAAGGAATVSMLPSRWVKPVVDVGVLPAHAQVSATPTLPPDLTPTATIQAPYAINSLTFYNPDTNTAFFHPGDPIATYATVMPAAPNLALYARITLQQPSHYQNGVVAEGTRLTDVNGRSALFEFDTSILFYPPDPGAQRYRIDWGFTNPSDGWNSLTGYVDILPVPGPSSND